MATNAEINDLLAAIESRSSSYSFRFVQSRLALNGMPTAVGWAPLKLKYKTVPVAERIRYKAVLVELYRDAVLFGRRAVSIYTVDKQLLNKLALQSHSAVTPGTPYAKTYPQPLSNAVLRKQSHNGTFVSHKSSSSGTIRLIACAKRSYMEREPVDIGNLSPSAQQALNAFDEVIGVRHGIVQAFDVIVIRPSDGRIEVHIDLPCRLSEEDVKQARKYYLGILINTLPKSYPKSFLESADNLFPLVKTFYADRTGVISGLGHATGTNSLKQERMRNRRQDLRDETFHKEGIDAIKSTEPYAISIGWGSTDSKHTPTIDLSGRSSLVGSQRPFIGHAILEQCANQSDYSKLINKLI